MNVSYVLGGMQLLAQRRGGVNSYYLSDVQGSVRALTSAAPVAITDTYSYSAFGKTTSTGSTTNPYRYTGQQFDTQTGLYSLRARYYDPNIGRFASRDPMGVNTQNPIELNRYVYAANNPINFGDPSGELKIEFAKLLTLPTGIIGERVLTAIAYRVGSYLEGWYAVLSARNYINELRQFLSVGETSSTVGIWMSRITVAAGNVNGRLTLAVNGDVADDAIVSIRLWALQLQNRGIQVIFDPVTAEHAERSLYNFSLQVATRAGLFVDQVLPAIGISNGNGVCPSCQSFFNGVIQQIPVYALEVIKK